MFSSITFRGIERLLIVSCAIFSIYLGYRLYIFGIDQGQSEVSFLSKLGNLVASGRGPGLFLMFFGTIVLIIALYSGRAKREVSSSNTIPAESVPNVDDLWGEFNRIEKFNRTIDPNKSMPEPEAIKKNLAKAVTKLVNSLHHQYPGIEVKPIQSYEGKDFALEIAIPKDDLSLDQVKETCRNECMKIEEEFGLSILPRVVYKE